ncbi:MAG: alcohol dehydrogenase catalytic domain-containing protein [Clostridiaceae bacterium]|nr:alcohol dehydrogenase catalytic domain-containing protein [Clostridiaceae bacterium]
MTNYSVKYYGPKDVRIEPYTQIPAIDDGELLVEVECCAVCGTDLKSYMSGNSRIKPPMIMGHEFCGTIIDLGANTTNYKKGQRITMATTIGCGTCIYCKQGKTNLCRSAEAMGFHYHGAMAPYIKIPEKAVRQNYLVDVQNMDARIASLAEPLSCAINNITRMPWEERKSFLIIGMGPLGMLHAIVLRELGAENIICVEFPGKRTEMTEHMGFQAVHPDEIDKRYLELSGSEGFDHVIITAPSNEIQSKAPLYARKSGYVSYFASLPKGNEILNMNSRTIHYNELVLYGTSDSTVEHVKKAVDIMSKNPGVFRELITHEMKMEDFHKAIDEIKNGNAVKVLLFP